ncbi:hypothetical protein GW756_01905 [bacterium]|nr:hypothetical protein [bacterium]NCQ55108.1 hypothetical protein [Candidatus Parcubacteria bacterium]NCS68051.1 hypothetical protein [Candidatus Peregrinibacteria bacterium]NCS96098.1 hypothetical protein [bacterium]
METKTALALKPQPNPLKIALRYVNELEGVPNAPILLQAISGVSEEEITEISNLDTVDVWSDDQSNAAIIAYKLAQKTPTEIEALLIRVNEITTDQFSSTDKSSAVYERVFLRFLKQYLLSTPQLVVKTRQASLRVVRKD